MDAKLSPDQIARYAESLLTLFQREHELLCCLLESIDLELAALQATDVAEIENAAESKHRLIEELEQQDKVRRALLTEAGFMSNPSGIDQFILRCDPELRHALRGTWDEIQALIRRCQNDNTRNGELNALSQRIVKHMLSFLRGESPDNNVYNQDGQVPDITQKVLGRV